MSDALWIAGLLFLVFPGLILWRLPLVGRLDLPARLSIAFAGGVAIVTLLLYAYSFAHVPWTRTTVGVPLVVLGVLGVKAGTLAGHRRRGRRRYMFIVLIFAVLTIYGVATARETCADLIYFWGPKAERFHYAGKIEAGFLAFEPYYLMHPDYPPLLPLTYAWPSLVAHRFSWWGPLFLMPIALLATAFAFRGLAQEDGWYTTLLVAILGYGFAIGMAAGGADPPLLMFEVIAITALTFAGDQRDAQILAAIALAAVAFTKVEGAAFVAITIVAHLLVTRKATRTALIALPSTLLLGSWIVFSSRHNLLDSYDRARSPLHVELFGMTIASTFRQASYNIFYVPWVAALAPLAIARRFGRALLPLIVAAGSIAATIFFYLHAEDPELWIASSAQRVLLTPLACLVVASAAARK